jgi:hypothetical protein
MPNNLKKAALFVAVISILVFPAFADRTTLRAAWNLFTPQQDVELGRTLADDAERTFDLVDQPNANSYIDALGKQLSVHAPGTRYAYQFKIVNDDAVNAWALPGGFIYVTSGLIRAAENEPQLAGLLAREIAHVALRHGTAEVSQAYGDRFGTTTRGRVSVDDAITRLNLRFEPEAIPLKFTREEERQATVLATQIMWDAKFDPANMTRFYQNLARDRSNRTADFFSAHPYLANHATVVRNELRTLGGLPRNVRGDSPDFHSVKDRLLASNNGNWPSISDRNRGDRPDAPSTRMVWYRGRDVEFRHPDNWRVSEQGDSVSVAPDGGDVSGALAYGLQVSTFDPQGSYFGRNSLFGQGTRANSTTLANATDQLIAYSQQSNPNLHVVGNNQQRRVDGEQAMVVELTNDSPLGGNERDWLVAVLRPNGMLRYFIGVAPQRDFNQYRTVFDQIVTSVRLLD